MSDRKYRQRGYQDDDRPSRRKSGPKPPKERREGPRGRGLGRPTESAFRCNACGRKIELAGGDVAVDRTCPHCNADLHSCSNCLHFDPSARFECRQPVTEPVRKKAKRNECSLFAPKLVQVFASETRYTPEEARAAFDDLFKI